MAKIWYWKSRVRIPTRTGASVWPWIPGSRQSMHGEALVPGAGMWCWVSPLGSMTLSHTTLHQRVGPSRLVIHIEGRSADSTVCQHIGRVTVLRMSVCSWRLQTFGGQEIKDRGFRYPRHARDGWVRCA